MSPPSWNFKLKPFAFSKEEAKKEMENFSEGEQNTSVASSVEMKACEEEESGWRRSCLEQPMPKRKKLPEYDFVAQTFISLCEEEYKKSLSSITALWNNSLAKKNEKNGCDAHMPTWLGKKAKSLKPEPVIIKAKLDMPKTDRSIEIVKIQVKDIEYIHAIPTSDGYLQTKNNIRSEDEEQLTNAPYIADDVAWSKTFYRDVDDVYGDIPIREELYTMPSHVFMKFVQVINDHLEKGLSGTKYGILTRPSSSFPTRRVFSLIARVFPHMGDSASLEDHYHEIIHPKSPKDEKYLNQRLKQIFCQRCLCFNCMGHDKEEVSTMQVNKKCDQKENENPCGLSCYITQHRRPITSNPEDIWSDDEKKVVKQLFEMFPNSCCEIAIMLKTSKTCQNVYRFAQENEYIVKTQMNPQNLLKSAEDIVSPQKDIKTLYNSWAKRQLDLIKISEEEIRKVPQYQPCNHPGRHCSKIDNCRCVQNGTSCEKFCSCSINCTNRFPGCRCKNCPRSKSCACAIAMRECDPDICRSCDADNMDASTTRCLNMPIQLGLGQRVLLGRSQIHGWGVFTRNAVKKNAFIIEYCGEIISREEAERRGTINHLRGGSFLFKLNEDFEVDASKIGNITRFINHSKAPNCYAEVWLVNGDHRIGVFAKKDIQPNEELRFDYGKQFVSVLPLTG